MPDAQDDYPLAFHPIAQNIGPDCRHLALAIASVPPAIRKLGEAVGQLDQPPAEPFRRRRIID